MKSYLGKLGGLASLSAFANTTGYLSTGMGPRTSRTGRQGMPGGMKTPEMAPNGGNVPSKNKSKIYFQISCCQIV